MANTQDNKFISVDRAIRENNPTLYKVMPAFLLRFMAAIIRQKELNSIMRDYKDMENFEFCKAVCKRYNVSVETIGGENIPLEGGAIFAANHPLGGMDAMAIMESISHYRSDVKFLVNDLLMTVTNLKGIFVGVNKFKGNPRAAIRKVDELFASDNAVFIFPAGLVSRMTKHGRIRDTEWKKTFIAKSKRHNKPVIPVHIGGRLSTRFYWIARLRKFLRIKMNIEMIFLADEMIRQKNKTVKIIYGKPIDPQTFDKSKTEEQWAYEVKSEVYRLRDIAEGK